MKNIANAVRSAARNAPKSSAWRDISRPVIPQGAAGWTMELIPDALGFAAASSYGGLGAGAENAAISLGGSFGGRFAGSGLAYGLAKLTGKSPEQMRNMTQMGAMIGGMTGGMGFSMLAPRPFTDHMRKQQEEELFNQQQLQNNVLYQSAASSPFVQDYDALLSQLAGVRS